MAAALPGARLRPHVKAHKCTGARPRARPRPATAASPAPPSARSRAWPPPGWATTSCSPTRSSTPAASGAVVEAGAGSPLAVDSEATIDAAAAGGVREVVIDVNVGLPRCGCAPEDAGRLADAARAAGLEVRGVMGYEGHVVGLEDRAARERRRPSAWSCWSRAHGDVGRRAGLGRRHRHLRHQHLGHRDPGRLLRADGHRLRQARPAVPAGARSCSPPSSRCRPRWAVADCGLKALGMDHGNPTDRRRDVWFCSDEHITFSPDPRLPVGDRIRVCPPTSTRPSPTTSACTWSTPPARSSTCGPSTSAAGSSPVLATTGRAGRGPLSQDRSGHRQSRWARLQDAENGRA